MSEQDIRDDGGGDVGTSLQHGDPPAPATGTAAPRIDGWTAAARGAGVNLFLHPPVRTGIACHVPAWLVFVPYARAAVDMALGEGPRRRHAWHPGRALVVPPGTRVEAELAEAVEYLCIAVAAGRAEAEIARVARGRAWTPQVIEAFDDPGLAALAQEARRALLGDPLIEPAYLERLGDATFARIGCHLTGAAIGSQAKEAISLGVLRRIVQHIEAHLGEKLVVEDLAESAGLSRSHFTRAFRTATGEAPQDFIISRRLCRARELLSDTDRGIAEIAAATGFSSQAHLSTAFRKRIGVTPGRYRAAFPREG